MPAKKTGVVSRRSTLLIEKELPKSAYIKIISVMGVTALLVVKKIVIDKIITKT
jgi:hypothetical protein